MKSIGCVKVVKIYWKKMFPNAPKGEWNRYHLFFDLQIGFSEVSSVEILGILTKGKYETRNHKELIYSDLINVKQLEIETHEGKINRFTLTQFIKNKIANQEFRTLLNTKVKSTALHNLCIGKLIEVSKILKKELKLIKIDKLGEMENNDFFEIVGEITEEIAKKIGLEAKPIIANDKSIIHIEEEHSKELEQLAISPIDYVKMVANNFNEIRQGKKNSILLVAKSMYRSNVAIVQLKFIYEGNYYLVMTATPMNNRFLKNKKLLWQRNAPI